MSLSTTTEETFPTQTPETTTSVDKDYEYCEREVFKSGGHLVSSYSHWFLIPSVLILLVLAFLEKRQSAKLELLGGRPGLPRPFSFLDEPRNKWGIVFAFGSATANLLQVLNKTFSAEFPVWAKIFLVYILSLETSLICYPLFACISSRYKLVGAITGVLYSSGWLSFQLFRIVTVARCYTKYNGVESVDLAGASIAMELPIVLFSLLVVIKFVWKLAKCLKQKKYSRSRSEEVGKKLCRKSDLLHVKALFHPRRCTEAEKAEKTMPCCTSWFRKFVKPFPGFKFPIGMLITTFVSCIFIYWYVNFLFIFLVSFFNNFISAANMFACLITVLCGLRNVHLVLMNYKRDMLCLYKGDKSFIPAVLRNCSPNIYMAQGMRFIGNSIVGSFWGSVFVYVVVYVPVALMLLTLKYLDDKDKLHLLWPRFEWLIYPACTILIFKIQTILVAKFFMQPKLEEIDKYKPLAVNNRTVYDVFSFFMLFLNASIGLVQYVKRILFSAVLGVFLIPRMDRSLYMRGYETMDKCYTNYIGMILVDVAHNHPVMRVFCHVLSDAMERTRNRATATTEYPPYADVRPEQQDKELSIAKRRWLLAFTLVRNPDLQQLRVHGTHNIKDDNSVYVDVSDITVVDAEKSSGISDNMVMDTWGCVCRFCKNYKFTIPPNITTNIMAGIVLFAILIIYFGLPLILKTLY
ncbi:stimulated by retinoic acid gene 6 protein-like [Mya arenaria]|uniref:stimulated by retinoic acid gene 6 protein-like n=1 Tax=Mya arenaria TaxID=6604 RepID=UPI0022E5C2B3|nr:stimulated by retinoic acid gene 6 protein-like [Mya arenaria]